MHPISPIEQRQRRLRLALAAVALGVAAQAFVWSRSEVPQPLWLWMLFAAAFVYFEWNSVEVNDRLVGSPTVMVALTAAVAFGPNAAAGGVAAMVAVALLTPADIRERRWFQPAVNFGQLTISAVVSISVLSWFLADVPQIAGNLWRTAVGSAVAALVYGIVNYNLVALLVRLAFGPSQVRPWSNVVALNIPFLGMGFLGGLLGAAYHLVGPVTLPLIFMVFFVGHMTVSSYSQLREAQESTLRGFIKALEAKDLYTRGHTERVAHFAELIGERLGFNGTQLERLRWAALIHDVGKLAVPRELIRKRARLSDEEYRQMQAHVHLVEELLSEVEFLRPMVDIAINHHAHYDGNGYHGREGQSGFPPAVEARILAVADSFDAMTSTRSYRVALSQAYAFGELRRHAGTQFDPSIVETFISVLEGRSEEYGSPDVHSEQEARRRAEGAGVVVDV